MDCRAVANLREQAASKVLPTDGRRKEATDKRTLEVVAAFGRDRGRAAAGGEIKKEVPSDEWRDEGKKRQRWPVSFWRRKKREAELEEEVRSHLEMAARERVERGEAAEEAEHSARREFGNVGLVKEMARDVWGWRSLDRLMQDLRFGVRMIAKSRGFTAVAILTLALGIGVNTALFSVVNGVLLNPLPYPEPDQLVRLHESKPN